MRLEQGLFLRSNVHTLIYLALFTSSQRQFHGLALRQISRPYTTKADKSNRDPLSLAK